MLFLYIWFIDYDFIYMVFIYIYIVILFFIYILLYLIYNDLSRPARFFITLIDFYQLLIYGKILLKKLFNYFKFF